MGGTGTGPHPRSSKLNVNTSPPLNRQNANPDDNGLSSERWLADVPAVGVTALMTVISSVAFLAPAAVNLPRQLPAASSILALVTLGIINTGVAYWLFYVVIDQAGAATASVITYVMPVVALFLGVGLLGEQLTIGAFAGLILIGLGAWLATSRQRPGTSGDQELRTVPGGRLG